MRKRIRDKRQRLLIGLAARGSEDAFRRLYRELFPPVSRYVLARLPAREDAEDVTANVFRSFLTHLNGYDPQRGSVMTWVVTMARNAVIDYYRRACPDCAGSGWLYGVGSEILADAGPDQLQLITGREEIERVRRALARQPAEIREMISLRFEQGLCVSEVAGVMGLSVDAAKQRYARAFRKLQKELTERDKPRRGEKPCTATD